MKRTYQINDKVIPLNKTPRIRMHDNCATYYKGLEMNQEFLYVVGYDEEEEKRLNTPCYWCNVIPVLNGDSFAEKDLVPYIEKENEEGVAI